MNTMNTLRDNMGFTGAIDFLKSKLFTDGFSISSKEESEEEWLKCYYNLCYKYNRYDDALPYPREAYKIASKLYLVMTARDGWHDEVIDLIEKTIRNSDHSNHQSVNRDSQFWIPERLDSDDTTSMRSNIGGWPFPSNPHAHVQLTSGSMEMDNDYEEYRGYDKSHFDYLNSRSKLSFEYSNSCEDISWCNKNGQRHIIHMLENGDEYFYGVLKNKSSDKIICYLTINLIDEEYVIVGHYNRAIKFKKDVTPDALYYLCNTYTDNRLEFIDWLTYKKHDPKKKCIIDLSNDVIIEPSIRSPIRDGHRYIGDPIKMSTITINHNNKLFKIPYYEYGQHRI